MSAIVSYLPKRQISDSSKLNEFQDDYSKFDLNLEKFFKRVENTVIKGEIARYEQFLLFPQRFQIFALQTCKNGLFGKGLNIFYAEKNLTVSYRVDLISERTFHAA